MKLDRLGIIELLPGNRGRPLTARNFRWRADGPIERYFRHALLGDYFADPFDGEQDALYLLSGSLSAEGVRQLKQRLEEVAHEFDAPARARCDVACRAARRRQPGAGAETVAAEAVPAVSAGAGMKAFPRLFPALRRDSNTARR